MALRRPNKEMETAASVGMVEADPAPGPSLALRDDMAGTLAYFHSNDTTG